MKIQLALVCLAIGAATSGCSQALDFHFGFTATDDGDMVKSVDQSVGDLASGDLAMSGDVDLAMSGDFAISNDLATSSDLHGTGDLRASNGDLKPTDLGKPDLAQPDLAQPDLASSRLGTACNPSDLNPCGLSLGLTCLTQYETKNMTVQIANGYCTHACDADDVCAPYNGACRPLGKSGGYCMPTCISECARDDQACCLFCTDISSGTSCTLGNVCAPPAAPGFLCAGGG